MKRKITLHIWSFTDGIKIDDPKDFRSTVQFTTSSTGGVYSGIAILPEPGITSNDPILNWAPHKNQITGELPTPRIVVVLGLGCGWIYHQENPEKTSVYKIHQFEESLVQVVEYHNGFVSFHVCGQLINVIVDDSFVKKMKTVIHFISGFADSNDWASIIASGKPIDSLPFNSLTTF